MIGPLIASVVAGVVMSLALFSAIRWAFNRFGDSDSAMLGATMFLSVGWVAALIGAGRGIAWLFG